MKKSSFIIVNPFNNYHCQLISTCEKDNNITDGISAQINKIKSKTTKESYEYQERENNELQKILLLEQDDYPEAIALLHVYKDIKSCYLTFVYQKNATKQKNLLKGILSYAVEGLKMKEVFVSIDTDDNSSAINLIENGFENLGEYSNQLNFVIDSESVKEREGILSGNRKKH